MLFAPKLPDYDIEEWRSAPFPVRVQRVCQAWAADGYGTPLAIFAVYGVKILAYIGVWAWFCTFTPGNSWSSFGSWWASDVAFHKAILWTMLFEGLGFGCGSGPLTGRYLPPVGPVLYFLRPGTTKLPLLRGAPVVGGHQRTILDVALYLAVLAVLIAGLTAPAVSGWHFGALVLLIPLAALGDKTLFLVFRSEHYLSLCVCMLFADWIAGSKVVWMAVWWWAATSKLNVHFPAVMGVMTSNAPFTRGSPLREWVYRDAPHDLRPSRLAAAMAHFGTATEYLVPLMLLLGDGGPFTAMGLFIITGFHLFILANVPMGVPLEWNVLMIYGALVLFGVHADVGVLEVGNPVLWLWLLSFHVALPLYGSLFPADVSFLLSMRYYAGNWAYNVWLFRGDSVAKLDQLTKWSPLVHDQLRLFYDDDTIDGVLSKALAFRHMHVLGRTLHDVVEPATRGAPGGIDDYQWFDGELVAGMVVGWNFGEGHLSNEELLEAVQAQCDFEPGELRVICVESQPLFGRDVAWRIVDAADGEMGHGVADVNELAERHPWPAV